jgi:hypothetical protein
MPPSFSVSNEVLPKVKYSCLHGRQNTLKEKERTENQGRPVSQVAAVEAEEFRPEVSL